MSFVRALPRAEAPDRSALRWAEAFFWTVGVVLLGWCAWVWLGARVYQARQESAFEIVRRPAASPAAAIPAARPDAASEARRTGLDPLLIGKLEIPRLGVSSIIREGIEEDTLRRAVGHVPGTALFSDEGNVALAGHRDTFFRGLRTVAKGDTIRVKTLTSSYTYHVVSTEIVWPEDTRVLDSDGTSMLTLVTCWPFDFVGHAPKRFIVKARRVS
jgi:sortase A